jgi:hypothetical protein
VTEEDGSEDVKGVATLLLVQLIFAGITFALTFFFFRSAPKTPPSASAHETHQERGNVDITAQLKNLFSKPDYLKLLFSFTIALGQLNALAALIGQLPGDYSNTEYGSLGAVLILCGFTGAFMTGFVLNHSKAYMQVLQG